MSAAYRVRHEIPFQLGPNVTKHVIDLVTSILIRFVNQK